MMTEEQNSASGSQESEARGDSGTKRASSNSEEDRARTNGGTKHSHGRREQ